MNRRHIKSTVVGILKFHHLYNDAFKLKKNRQIRVFLPSDYYENPNETYDVIYMLDAQNLFDEKAAYVYKEWKIDETIEGLKDKIKPQIVVGLDCSMDRMSEYLPHWTDEQIEDFEPNSNITWEFLINRVMPFIEKKYRVNKGREHTSFGGSSMGGLMAFEAILEHNDLFSKYYAFSPAFALFRYGFTEMPGEMDNGDEVLDNILEEVKKSNLDFKLAITSGGQGYEAQYAPVVDKIQLELSPLLKDNLLVLQDLSLCHDENQWAKFFVNAYKFMNK